MLSRIIYYSSNLNAKGLEGIRAIYSEAQKKNNSKGITGLLYHNEKYFLQVLEGERSKINKLYNKIALDKRHDSVTLASAEDVNERSFEKWSMLYVHEANIDEFELLKYLPEGTFDPNLMSAENIKTFALNVKVKHDDEYLNPPT